MVLLWLIVPSRATPIDCEAAVEKTVLDRLLDQAETAVKELDPTTLDESIDRAKLLARCVEVALTPDDIARLYRLSGISLYVQQDLVAAVADFEVARALEPDARIDDSLGQPLRITYDAVPAPSGDRFGLPEPIEGSLRVDGAPDDTAPADRGYAVQWFDGDGRIRGTWFLGEGERPTYPARGEEAPREPKAHGRKKPLLLSGIASSALGIGGIVGAVVLESQFDGSDRPSSDLQAQIAANRALAYGGVGLGAIGIGLVGTSFVVEF